MLLVIRSILVAAALAGATAISAQEARFDDVVRNLRNPDPDVRMRALRLLREARHPEAIAPIAALVTDPHDAIQLEAIATELSFYLVEHVPARRRVALVIEQRRAAGRAAAAFDAGPLAIWPRPVPSELMRTLLQATDDEEPRVRLEAIYALGTIARAPLPEEFEAPLIRVLDHYDPAMRAAAAKVIGRLQVGSAGDALIRAVNDSTAPVRYAAMRALGSIRELRAVKALVEQLAFYGRGEGAWSALDALAGIAHASTVPLFESRLADRDPFMRRAAIEGLARAGAGSHAARLDARLEDEPSEMVRAAIAFALQKGGRDAAARLAGAMRSPALAQQVTGYLLELGPSIVPALLPHLQSPEPAIRGNVALVLGALGTDANLPALTPLLQDPSRDVAQAAARAIERIKMRRPTAQGSHAAQQSVSGRRSDGPS